MSDTTLIDNDASINDTSLLSGDASSRTIWVSGQPFGNAYINIKSDNTIEAPIGAEIFNDFENNIASGDYAHAEGKGTIANNEAEHAEGKYNKSNTNTIHSVGIGTSKNARKNAVEVMQNGDVYINGIGAYDGTNIETATSVQEVVEETNTKINSLTEKTTSLDSRTPVDSGISFMRPWELFPEYSEDVQDVQNYILAGLLQINNQMTNVDGLFNHIRDNNLAGKSAYFTIYGSVGNPSVAIIGNIDTGAVGYKISFSTISRYSDGTTFNNRLIFFEIEIGNPTGDGIIIMNSRLMNIPIKDTLSQIDNNTSKIQTLETKNAELTNTITELESRVTNAVQITYAELKSLRDAGTLVPGQQYRITDYTCTTTQANAKSAGHVFDIIVTADDESTLNEVAKAIKHEGDTYFANSDLNAWKIWYCLDNDINRFDWADTTNGKGVIYRMIDEFNNDCPYDFKNIQFYRQWDSVRSLWSVISADNTGVPCYTFSSTGNSATISFTDMSLSISNNVYSNVIGEYVSSNGQTLNNICFFGNYCNSNTFGNNCYSNTFGNLCYSNTFGNTCDSNTFGNSCYLNTFGNGYYSNTFGNLCYYNTFGNNCYLNTFGNGYYSNTFGNNCNSNTFGNNCNYNTFGNNCSNIKLASDASATTKYNYYQRNHFGDGCQYIVFTGAETASSAQRVQNYNFAQGLQGTSSAYLTIDGKRGRTYETYISKDTDGTIKESVIAEKIDKIIEISYADLVTLRGSSKLVPGQQYRITDYTCTTTQANTKSAGNVFDIIVTADDEGTLNEVARAAHHLGDTYFANCDLNAWKLWYCLDNDTNRFVWADETNGKGVIYRMIDEWNNDCPYDFKNIQFYRKWNATKSLWCIISSDNTGVPCYTFSSSGNSATTLFTDYSLASSNNVYSNVIRKYVNGKKQTLNNNCFFGNNCYSNTFGNNCCYNTFGNYCKYNAFGNGCGSNTFGNNCYSNTFRDDCDSNTFGNDCKYNAFGNYCKYNAFGNNCWYNTFGNDCWYNTFGNDCYSNTFGNDCSRNTFGNKCSRNTFGNDCGNNTFGNSCGNNTFGNDYSSNTFGNNCWYNTFGNYCQNNTFGHDCSSNTFGNDCGNNTFGNNCSSNTFGNRCIYIKFASDSSASTKYNYYQNNYFGDGCAYLVFKGTETASSSSQIQNYKFAQGLQGTSSAYLTIGGVRGRSFETKVAKNSNGELKVYCEADLIL